MQKLIIGLLGASALGIASAASAQVVPLNSPDTVTGGGTVATYTTGAGTITATGYSGPGTPTALAFKSAGDDENGVGLLNDPQNEISNAVGNFIQIDVSGLMSGSTVSFLMGSTTLAEGWAVFGTDDAGCATSGFQCGTSVGSGNDEGVWHTLTGGYDFYDFYATGTNSEGSTQAANVLLGSLNVAVPEPSTWAMMLLGFGPIGMAARRSRKNGALVQLA